MKVLFVSSGNTKEGMSPIIKKQGDSLICQGVNIGFFTIKGKGIWSYLKHIYILKKYLKTTEYNIIHAHYGFSGIVAFLASRKEKIVVSFMGDDILGTNKYDGRQTFISRLIVKLNLFFSRKYYDYSIVKTKQMLKVFKDTAKVVICPNGVNLSDFFPVDQSVAFRETGFSSLSRNIIFVSDPLRAEKNYSLARDAVHQLNDDSIILQSVFNIQNDKLKYFYSVADLLLMTSFHEGSPNIIKEAMACNCPIVSTDVGDVRRIFGETKGCFICSFEPADVAEKINLALEFSKSVGRTTGRKRIIEIGLDSETIAHKIIKIYNEVLKNGCVESVEL